MSRMLSGMVGRMADKLLPQTSAAAGCGGCETFRKSSGGQIYFVKCCWTPSCVLRCP
ncbi:hypothetical protein ACFXAW_02315 [Streptomyces sp. NPDC059445]|uniref:hypothetical protein n=1 Tax=Streptomyces sp. NPDC059445 TaxID=3346832 RepID=UPI0036835D82